MSQKQQQQPKQNLGLDLTETLVDVRPSAVQFNLDLQDVEAFASDLLAEEGFEPIAIASNVIRAAGQNQVVIAAVYDRNNKVFQTSSANISPMLRDRIPATSLQASSEFTSALLPIADLNDRNKPRIATREGKAVCYLDIFSIVELMLAVKRNVHELTIRVIDGGRVRLEVTKTYQGGKKRNHNKGGNFSNLLR